ncbi:MAG: peptide chain release factor N(5)-glutamine methyltransferase [Planctomycetota bacterium]|nr:MAG: peptide chain release factor N(5)-glutamine methyltransferase [Planctomycetota bacterium]
MTETSRESWTVGRLLEWTTDWFKQKDVEGGRLAAELLLARAMNCPKIELYTRYHVEPTPQQRDAFRELVSRASEHTPIAYLLGSREFYSLDFLVTPAVLIPRPETEAIVQRAIELCRQLPDRHWRILDVGTGSGCIAIAIAYYADNASVIASDLSAGTLEVATQNVDRHQVSDRVRLVEADCVTLPQEFIPDDGFDIIVSNPPYISSRQWSELPPNVRDYEPKIALVMEDGDGLVMYRRLAAEAPEVLKKRGRLLVELGYDQHTAVLEIFENAGRWNYIDSHRNTGDVYDRVAEFELR